MLVSQQRPRGLILQLLQSLQLACLLALPAVAAAAEKAGPLQDYVARPDESFKWVERRRGEAGGGSFVELILTSQKWHDVVWRHQLFIYKPAEVRDRSRAMLVIAGGRWRDELAQPANPETDKLPGEAALVAALAQQIGSPVAVLLQVPQQPIFDGLVEDQAISYTFAKYLETEDATWPLLLPMVKSAVRAMDAMQGWTKEQWQLELKKFTVAGASKRGWTTWLTAAVDERVAALAPMVIDTLNMGPQMKHQLATWGKFSEQIHDYTERGIQNHLATERGEALRGIIDPYSYRAALVQPKLILLGTNDRYWPLDALNLYWEGLSGEKYVLYCPNQGHGIRDFPRVVGTVSALHRAAAGELKLPKLSWKLTEADGKLTLHVESDAAPREVSAWVATAPTRDFRDAKWESHPAESRAGAWYYELPMPEKGFAAMFGEAVFATDKLPFYLSTNVKIVGK